MKRVYLLLLVCLLICGVVAPAVAYCPAEWFFVAGPYGFSQRQNHWFYMDAASSMWCFDYSSGTWIEFPTDFVGWVYFDWPHGYSVQTCRWYFFSGTDPVWFFNLVDSGWTAFGVPSYTAADVPGTWVINELMVFAADQDITVGTVDAVANGSFTGTMADETGVPQAVTGWVTTGVDGSVDVDLTAAPDPAPVQLSASRTFAVGSRTSGSTYSYLYTMSRRGTGYSAAHLTGLWMYYQISSEDSSVQLTAGPMDIAGGGAFTAYFHDKTGTPDVVTGTCGIDSLGVASFTPVGSPGSIQMDMTATKDVLIRARSEASGGSGYRGSLGIALKRAASYGANDLVGTWRYSALRADATTHYSERGTMCLYADGTLVIRYFPGTGAPVTGTSGWAWSGSAPGMFYIAGHECQLNETRDVFAAAWYSSDSVWMLIGVRNVE